MAKYITRTIDTFNTKVTFVMNNQINEYVLTGVVGKKEAKKHIQKFFNKDNKDVVIVSCEKVVESSKLYRMLESNFIAHAEIVTADTSTEV